MTKTDGNVEDSNCKNNSTDIAVLDVSINLSAANRSQKNILLTSIIWKKKTGL